MVNLLIRLVINVVAICIAAYVLPGIQVQDFATAVLVAIVLGLINTFIRPILKLVTLPINVMTLGLFTLVIDGFLVWLTSVFVDTFVVQNFLWAILFSIIITIINSILSWIFKDKE